MNRPTEEIETCAEQLAPTYPHSWEQVAAYIAELERDRARLDWLQEKEADLHCAKDGKWALWARNIELLGQPSLRACIDDAMQS